MKRLVIATLAVLLTAVSAFAIPARPGSFTYRQPDGSVVRLTLHGDEFFHWTTLADSQQVVELDDDGYWRPASINSSARQAARQRRSAVNRGREMAAPYRGTHNSNPMTHGERHIPVLLVSFPDQDFQIEDPNTSFHNLLNQSGYAENGGTGSVHDFFIDNSHGAFVPVFDVYGPVQLPQPMKYYGGNQGTNGGDKQPHLAFYDAAVLLDETVDFSRYDTDNDGIIDMSLFYYAGYSEAEGGKKDAIWPHQWNIQSSGNSTITNATFDGKRLGAYFCTAELKGVSGVNMCGIGPTCHEFSHSLGLPDFYDADYEDNGYCGGLYAFSTMCSGPYNNDSRTPPYFNAEERILLGWMSWEDVPEPQEGTNSFGSIKDDFTLMSPTDIEGEYFLYECRDGSGWDAPLPKGLMVYHVDKSTVRRVGSFTPYDLWRSWRSYNSINAYGSHPCFYAVPSADQGNLSYTGSSSGIIFPGRNSVVNYSPIDWDNNNTGIDISGISFSGGQVTFSAHYTDPPTISGTVVGQDGKAISGVYVVLTHPAYSSSRPMRVPARRRAQSGVVSTDDSGHFTVSLEGFEGDVAHLSFFKDGYQTAGQDVQLTSRKNKVSVKLLKRGEGGITEFTYYDEEADVYVTGLEGHGGTQMAAIRIPASELSSGGGTVLSVTLLPYYKASAYYIIVDSGEERILTYKSPEIGKGGKRNFITVELPQADFPAGKDLFIGYAVEDAQLDYDDCAFLVTEGGWHSYYSPFSLTQSKWGRSEEDNYDLIFSATVLGKIKEDPGEDPGETSLASMGFTTIHDPGNGVYKAGDAFALDLRLARGLSLIDRITWTLDGKKITDGAKSVSLPAGEHVIKAKYRLSTGTLEELELHVVAQ